MNPLLGLAVVSGAIAFSRGRKNRGLSGPMGDDLCSAAEGLEDLFLEWMNEDFLTERPHPHLPGQAIPVLKIDGANEEERCNKTRDAFYTLFNRTRKLEAAAGAKEAGDWPPFRLMRSRLRESRCARKAGFSADDLETMLHYSHAIQDTLLGGGTVRGCFNVRA